MTNRKRMRVRGRLYPDPHAPREKRRWELELLAAVGRRLLRSLGRALRAAARAAHGERREPLALDAVELDRLLARIALLGRDLDLHRGLVAVLGRLGDRDVAVEHLRAALALGQVGVGVLAELRDDGLAEVRVREL